MAAVPNTFLDLSTDHDDDVVYSPSHEHRHPRASELRPATLITFSNTASPSIEALSPIKSKSIKHGKAKIVDHRRAQPNAITPIDFHTTPEVEIRVPIINPSQPPSERVEIRPPQRLSERVIVSPRKPQFQPQNSPPNFSYPRSSLRNNPQITRFKSLSHSKPLPPPPPPELIDTPRELADKTAHRNPHARTTTEPAPIAQSTRQSAPQAIPKSTKSLRPKKEEDTDIQKYISTSLASILDRSLKLEAHLARPRTRWSTSTLGDGAEEVAEDVLPGANPVKQEEFSSEGVAELEGDTPEDCATCTTTLEPGRVSLGNEEWGDASVSSPGNLSGRASTLIESEVSSIFSAELTEIAEPLSAVEKPSPVPSSSPPHRSGKKLSLFPPTLDGPEKEGTYNLHCEFCSEAFTPSEFENWVNHTLTHFAPYPPPQSARCIFCDGFPTVEATMMLDPSQYWRERLLHLAQHFESGKTVAEAGIDEGTMEYMLERDLRAPRPLRRRRSHIEFDYESLERMERARRREMRRESERQRVVHDLSREDRQRRRDREKGRSKRKSKNDGFPVVAQPIVAKAKEIRIKRKVEEEEPKYRAVKRELVTWAPTPKPLPVVRAVDVRRGVRCEIY